MVNSIYINFFCIQGGIIVKVNWEKTSKNQGVLTVEISEEAVATAIDKAYMKLRKEINLPGFRKGKVPRNILEKRFGIEIFYEDASHFLLQEYYPKAIEEVKIEPVDRPEIDIEQMEAGKPFIFKATITVKPEVELGQYTKLGIEKIEKEITDADVEAEIDKIRNQDAVLEVAPEGATLENGDTAVIDFVGSIDGIEFPGGSGQNYPLVIGSGAFIPGFEEQLIGKSVGDVVDVKVTFPEQYHAQDLAGKDAVFKVTINEIKRKVLPELNDDFAKDHNFDNVEALKDDVFNKLKEKAKAEAQREYENKVIEKVLENSQVEIPGVMVDNKVEDMLKEMEQNLAQQGLDLETYFKFTGTTKEQVKEQLRPRAEEDVKFSLIMEAIIEKENFEITEEEFQQEIENIAKAYNQDVEKVKPILEAQKAFVEDGIKRRKAFELILAN
jgi:trigger factor